MATKRPAPTSEGSAKYQRKHMTLEGKVKLLDKCKEGMKIDDVARLFEVSESTVRSIIRQEEKIRGAVAAGAPSTAKAVSMSIKEMMIKNAPFSWIKDQNREGIDVANLMIQMVNSLLPHSTEDVPQPSTSQDAATLQTLIQASNSCSDEFKHRFGLKNMMITGESASADHEAAARFPDELQTLIVEKGYKPEQVWNMDETGLFWKTMPQKIFIAKEECRAPGFAAGEDRCTLIMCGNAAGHLIKAGFICKSERPRALQHLNLHLLPVYWMHNKKAWTTKELFLSWFHYCFLPEVKDYLERKGMEFKVLLILKNAPGRPSSIGVTVPNVQVVFFPPNTTALIQPMNQGVIKNFKALYSRHVMARLQEATDNDPDLNVKNYWKKYTIADCLSVVEESFQDVKPETVNACWKHVWPGCVKDFGSFSPDETFRQTVQEIVTLVKAVEGFEEEAEDDILELLEAHDQELIEEDLAEFVRSATEEEQEDDEQDKEEEGITLEKLEEMSRILEDLKQRAYSMDPSMARSLKFTRAMDDGFAGYKSILDEVKKLAKQLPITMFFPRREKEPPSPAEPDPERQPSPPSPPRTESPAPESTPAILPPEATILTSDEDGVHDPPSVSEGSDDSSI
ncbi:tigger transposable element-derived protein 1-like [Palaemon carinicauda]|uniref:tigger transposable element-derived protein 1-like n=1 Tax=Palaemon carinicauda TaxID=392227 RepID=UPI0035B5F479